MTVGPGNVKEILPDLRDISEVVKVFSVVGPYDLVVYVEADETSRIRELIRDRLMQIDGVKRTKALLLK